MAVIERAVNEERLLSLVHNFFSHPEFVLIELAQNAARSGATKLDIDLDGDRLKVRDNGKGISRPESLFVLADSDWSQDVEREQMPAGWGLFYLYSLSDNVTMKSRFGRIEFNCERFFSDSGYRKNVLALVDPEDKASGFEIEAVLKPGISDKLTEKKKNLGWFSMDILFNGEVVPRQSLDQYMKKDFIETTYHGNRVLIAPYTHSDLDDTLWLGTIWYGIPIDFEHFMSFHSGGYGGAMIDVRCGSPLTPVLPYRESIKRDKKFEEFREFVRKKAVNYLISRLNDDDDQLFCTMKALGRLALQEELDALDFFYVVQTEPYHEPYFEFRVDKIRKDILIWRDSPTLLVNEELVLKDMDEEDVFLPSGAIKSIYLPKRYPSWLPEKITKKEVRVKVVEDENFVPFQGIYFTWVKARIDGIEGTKILAYDGPYCPEVYYENLDDVFKDDFLELVFENLSYNDEGDTYNTQREDFFKCAREDFMKLTGKYDLHDMLSGLSLAGISPSKVRSIEVDKEAGKMVVVTNEGEEKTLKI